MNSGRDRTGGELPPHVPPNGREPGEDDVEEPDVPPCRVCRGMSYWIQLPSAAVLCAICHRPPKPTVRLDYDDEAEVIEAAISVFGAELRDVGA